MNPLNIIESLYSGVNYSQTLDMRLERNLKSYPKSRFPLQTDSKLNGGEITVTPYELNFERYNQMLTRVKVITSLKAPITLQSKSSDQDWDSVITSYSRDRAILSEPLGINSLELLYNYEDYKTQYLTPLGLLAVLFRKSYGNEKFRQYVNSTLLREDYYKISSRNSPTFYVHKNRNFNMEYIKSLGELFESDRWKTISDFLIMSPYIFSWRD